MADMELTVLMPCLNEAKTVAACIQAASNFIRQADIEGEVLIADNGSTDGSVEIALANGARVVSAEERGYGSAIMTGIANARGRYVVMGDADSSYDFSELHEYVKQLRAGSDLVMGNRFKGGIKPGAMPTLHKYLGNPVLSFIGRLFFRVNIGDFHCGLRGFSKTSIESLSLVTPGMEFASEMVAKSALAGLKITEVPTKLYPDGRDRAPHLRTWRDGWRHLRFLLLFCPRWLFLYPGIFLLATGFIGFATLTTGPVSLNLVGLDIHSMLYMAAATILGTQMVQLAVLTKWMGVLSGVVPAPKWLKHLTKFANLELGLIIGALLLGMGLMISLETLSEWRARNFGQMEPGNTMRKVIPAITLMIIGAQIFVTTFFAGALHFCWITPRQKNNAK